MSNSFFKKNSLWIGILLKYVTVFLLLSVISTFYFYWPSYSTFTYIIVGILVLGYFSPELYRLFFKVNVYEGEYRGALKNLVSKLNGNIRNFYIKQDTKHNAFALGFPTKRYISFHSITLEKCPWNEIEGVVAHEVGHHNNNDTLIYASTGIPTFLFGAWLSNYLIGEHSLVPLLLVSIPIALVILFIALGVSRWREHEADVFAKKYLENTNGLADFLERVVREYKEQGYNSTEFNPMLNLFSMHPSIPERVKYLRS